MNHGNGARLRGLFFVFPGVAKPELVKRWFGPQRWPVTTSEIREQQVFSDRSETRRPAANRDQRPWRQDPGGLGGSYCEGVPPGRIVSTKSFDDFPGESVNTLALVEDGGEDGVDGHGALCLKGNSNEVTKGGMETGAAETYDPLAAMLATSNTSG
jgi:uncharacterized protein YndB with AHSA1/START domain